jgi:hypothetical protein
MKKYWLPVALGFLTHALGLVCFALALGGNSSFFVNAGVAIEVPVMSIGGLVARNMDSLSAFPAVAAVGVIFWSGIWWVALWLFARARNPREPGAA